MSLRKEFLLAEAKKLAYVAVLIVVLQFVPGIQGILMARRFDEPVSDFIYVLAVSFLPSIIYSAISLILFSLVLSIIKMKLLPAPFLEKKYFGIKDRNLKAILFYSVIVVLVLYNPWHINSDSRISGIFSAFPQNPPEVSAQNPFPVIAYVVYLALLAPLYALFQLKIYSVAAGALYALFLVHILSVRVIGGTAKISRITSPRILEDGGTVTAITRITSVLPVLSYLRVSSDFRQDGIVSSKTIRNDSNLSGTRTDLEKTYVLRKGFYSADIAEISVATPPFFSKIYRASSTDASATVIPKSPDTYAFRNPQNAFEGRGGKLSKKMMNSSSDFAGIKEYIPGDQLNRVWWMGLAKSGALLTKNFYSTGEDSILLLPDLSDPDAGKEYSGALMSALSNIVSICSKKDILVSIYPVCSHSLRAESTRNRKELMFFIMNLNSITLISPDGAHRIFSDALPSWDYKKIRERCKNNNITLSSLYGASGFYKKGMSVFSWERKAVFLDSIRNFFKHQGKRNKAILITDSKAPLDALEKFRSMCLARNFRYVVVVLGKSGDKKENARLEKMRQSRIFAVPLSYSDAQRLSAIYGLLGRKIL